MDSVSWGLVLNLSIVSMLGIESKTSRMLGKGSTSEPQLQPSQVASYADSPM